MAIEPTEPASVTERDEGMGSIWLACSGEYEQWGPFAAFTTEELARQHSDDVLEFTVYDRPTRTERHWSRWVTVRPDGTHYDEHPKRCDDAWPEWLNERWGKPLTRNDVVGPYPHLGGAMWVIVEGNDEDAVDAEVERLILLAFDEALPERRR